LSGEINETRTYNARLQLTNLTNGNSAQYIYSATQNNGRITQMVASGETVNYTYDSLNRLIAAATPGTVPADWGLSFSYDGFGNRLSQLVTKGSAPTQTIIVKPQYNQVDGLTYDANGNQTTLNGVSMAYDVDNRLMTYGSNDEQYAYAPDNQRVWKKRSDGSEEVYFYSVSGQRLGIFEVYSPYATLLQFRQKETRIYFGGRPVTTRDANDTTTPVYPDRLGSLGSYFPYGEERTTTANDMPIKSPAHPGRIVRSACLAPLNLSVTAGARVLGVSRQALNNIVNGKAGISPEMAIRLTKAFGVRRRPGSECSLPMILRRPASTKARSRCAGSTQPSRRHPSLGLCRPLVIWNPMGELVAGAYFEAIHNALGAWLVRRWLLPKNGRRPVRS